MDPYNRVKKLLGFSLLDDMEKEDVRWRVERELAEGDEMSRRDIAEALADFVSRDDPKIRVTRAIAQLSKLPKEVVDAVYLRLDDLQVESAREATRAGERELDDLSSHHAGKSEAYSILNDLLEDIC
jgi:regulator of protease activity HflC (stomatin/prohibitin superfamily)